MDGMDSMDLLGDFASSNDSGSPNWMDDYSADVYNVSVAPSSGSNNADSVEAQWPFTSDDLGDLGDLTDFLDNDNDRGTTSDSASSDDLFEGLEIKTDIMFSSTIDDVLAAGQNTQNTPQTPNGRSKRRRDVSVTLSECAEGMLALKDMELLLEDSDCKDQTAKMTYGISPTFGNSFTFMDTPLASSESDTNDQGGSESDDDDEEIDVVNEEAASSSRTRVHTPKRKAGVKVAPPTTPQPAVKAGRSLLKVRPQPQTKAAAQPLSKPCHPPQQTIDHFNGDHSYFLARPKPVQDENAGNAGVLTPSESGEDTDSNGYNSSTSASFYSHGYSTLQDPKEVDKSKIVAAVQALASKGASLRGRGGSGETSDVKFRFKMRFKSNSPQRAAVAAQPTQRSLLISQPRTQSHHHHPYSHSHHQHNDRVRRKSASRNSHCPPPSTAVTTPTVTSSSPSVLSTPLNAGGHTTVRTAAAPAVKLEGGMSRRQSSSQAQQQSQQSRKSPEDKCREIRDLHNRMERQRRVDLKNNYDQLKDCVPALADVDKASKLNILNKAADYCRLLIASDQKLKKEVDKETVRNSQLRKRLNQLIDQHTSRKMSSGRIVHSARRFE